MNTETRKFKKGHLVTIVGSWNQFGTVYVRDFVVTSWGKKQATLVRTDDGSNAEFRVYTGADAYPVQGIRSQRIMATADYSDTLAMQIAEEFIVDEDKRAESRLAWVIEHYGENGTRGHDRSRIEFENGVYARHKATPWKAEVLKK
jgi:hypothetical protein